MKGKYLNEYEVENLKNGDKVWLESTHYKGLAKILDGKLFDYNKKELIQYENLTPYAVHLKNNRYVIAYEWIEEQLWEQFLNGEKAINCETKYEAKQFIKYCNFQKLTWNEGYNLETGTIILSRLENLWDEFESNTCYYYRNDIPNYLFYGSAKYFNNNGSKPVSFSTLMCDIINNTKSEYAYNKNDGGLKGRLLNTDEIERMDGQYVYFEVNKHNLKFASKALIKIENYFNCIFIYTENRDTLLVPFSLLEDGYNYEGYNFYELIEEPQSEQTITKEEYGHSNTYKPRVKQVDFMTVVNSGKTFSIEHKFLPKSLKNIDLEEFIEIVANLGINDTDIRDIIKNSKYYLQY